MGMSCKLALVQARGKWVLEHNVVLTHGIQYARVACRLVFSFCRMACVVYSGGNDQTSHRCINDGMSDESRSLSWSPADTCNGRMSVTRCQGCSYRKRKCI